MNMKPDIQMTPTDPAMFREIRYFIAHEVRGMSASLADKLADLETALWIARVAEAKAKAAVNARRPGPMFPALWS